jgi:lipoic acid synthetase
LFVLRRALEMRPEILTKSSIMLGLGESDEEVVQAMRDLRAAGVRVLTLGQYLRPTEKHLAVIDYIAPEKFDQLSEAARALGFDYVASGPLVRSSYRAAELFLLKTLRQGSEALRQEPQGRAERPHG